MKRLRDHSVDDVRGLAIFTMIAANMSADLLAAPHPFAFRVYGSFAAAIFTFVAGMMVALTMRTRNHGFWHYLSRGALVMAVGVIIDMGVWHIRPFTTVDVLYLIGAAMPLTYLATKLSRNAPLVVAIVIFAAAPDLRHLLGYGNYPTEYYLSGALTDPANIPMPIWHHWLVDGWFPFFPWLAFPMLGAWFENWRGTLNSASACNQILLSGITSLVVGLLLWVMEPGAMLIRMGYSEIFYPPTVGYCLTAVGIIFLCFAAAMRTRSARIWDLVRVLGEAPLFFYIVHEMIIVWVLQKFWKQLLLQNFVMLYLGVAIVLILIGYGLRALKSQWRKRPYLVNFLIGG